MNFPAFEMIAKPHRDILRGIFTADTYAAKLGQVVKKEGPQEYKNSKQFFEKLMRLKFKSTAFRCRRSLERP